MSVNIDALMVSHWLVVKYRTVTMKCAVNPCLGMYSYDMFTLGIFSLKILFKLLWKRSK